MDFDAVTNRRNYLPKYLNLTQFIRLYQALGINSYFKCPQRGVGKKKFQISTPFINFFSSYSTKTHYTYS